VVPDEYLPTAHETHEVAVAWYVPGAQLAHPMAPMAAYLPAGQAVQAVAWVPELYWPVEQLTHVTAPDPAE